jgi:hypothetical protein
VYCPPAQPDQDDYNILKFFAVDSLFAQVLLSGVDLQSIDLPFQLQAHQEEIIRLPVTQPILLLGRSGTGKTTICLYRMSSLYLKYWEIRQMDAPTLPRLKLRPTLPKIGDADLQATLRRMALRQLEEVDDDEPLFTVAAAPAEVNGADNTPLDHLHQVFITKNPVLLSEVKRSFDKMAASTTAAGAERLELQSNMPPRLQDVDQLSWPLFLSGSEWLMYLDASLPGKPFFKRDDRGALLDKVVFGIMERDVVIDVDTMLDPDSGDESDVQADGFEDDDAEDMIESRQSRRQRDRLRQAASGQQTRKLVDYDYFWQRVYPDICSRAERQLFRPALLWTEFLSHIKGSREAIVNVAGYISKEEYLDFGLKRSSVKSQSDREKVYVIFEKYRLFCKRRPALFDEADLARNLYARRVEQVHQGAGQFQPWSIHQVFVDEVQDFLESELIVTISCCDDPRALFLTGDTAQSIARGVGFRFSEVRRVFHFLPNVTPPPVQALPYNYRSHTGILRLASGVLEVLDTLFPGSFDKLDHDRGFFRGPLPSALLLCDVADLAVMLRSNRRSHDATSIEFGARQVILVANEQVKDNMPNALKDAVTLTIVEAKGLEFDDVLLYNVS